MSLSGKSCTPRRSKLASLMLFHPFIPPHVNFLSFLQLFTHHPPSCQTPLVDRAQFLLARLL